MEGSDRLILAQVKRLNPQADWDKFTRGGGWIYFALAAVTLVVLFAILLKIKEWLRPKGLVENSAEELLLRFRNIHQQGELSTEEYKRIRESLTKRSDESGSAGDSAGGPSADDSVENSPKVEH